MSKLYIFGIGGTGARVLRSLTMLLASGVQINTDEIVPIIIDADFSNEDLTRSVRLMKDYWTLSSSLKFDNTTANQFFKTKFNFNFLPSICLPLHNTRDIKFREFIGLSTMVDATGKPNANYALSSMLFSEDNLNSSMEIGFTGNPNIGSVVLNQFATSQEFKNIMSSFSQGDRFFIISSIFGGTGASGFPLLAKNLRSPNATLNNADLISAAPIGAITVLPYFGIKPKPDGKVDPSTFITKAKAALRYYDKNMNEVNALYYIADTLTMQYDYAEGSTDQKNNAHLIELASALAIVDFMKIQDTDLITFKNIPQNPIYREFAIQEDISEVIYSTLCAPTNRIIRKPLTQFELFSKYLREHIDDALGQPWARNIKVDNNFLQSDFYSLLLSFCKANDQWLSELATNIRAFTPFKLEANKEHLFNYVKGSEPFRLRTLDSNYKLFDSRLNDAVKNNTGNVLNDKSCFIEAFYKATGKLLSEKLKID